MAQLSTQTISRDGLNVSLASCAGGGDKFAHDARTFVLIQNDDGSSKTVTFDIVSTVDGQAVADRQVAVPAGEKRYVGPFTDSYKDADGNVAMTYSAVTNLKVAAIKL